MDFLDGNGNKRVNNGKKNKRTKKQKDGNGGKKLMGITQLKDMYLSGEIPEFVDPFTVLDKFTSKELDVDSGYYYMQMAAEEKKRNNSKKNNGEEDDKSVENELFDMMENKGSNAMKSLLDGFASNGGSVHFLKKLVKSTLGTENHVEHDNIPILDHRAISYLITNPYGDDYNSMCKIFYVDRGSKGELIGKGDGNGEDNVNNRRVDKMVCYSRLLEENANYTKLEKFFSIKYVSLRNKGKGPNKVDNIFEIKKGVYEKTTLHIAGVKKYNEMSKTVHSIEMECSIDSGTILCVYWIIDAPDNTTYLCMVCRSVKPIVIKRGIETLSRGDYEGVDKFTMDRLEPMETMKLDKWEVNVMGHFYTTNCIKCHFVPEEDN